MEREFRDAAKKERVSFEHPCFEILKRGPNLVRYIYEDKSKQSILAPNSRHSFGVPSQCLQRSNRRPVALSARRERRGGATAVSLRANEVSQSLDTYYAVAQTIIRTV